MGSKISGSFKPVALSASARIASPLLKLRLMKQRKNRETNDRVASFTVISLAAVCAVLFAVALYGFFAPLAPSRLLSNMGAATDPLYQKAMMSYAGLEKVAPETLSTDDGIQLSLAETFAWEEYKIRQGDTISKIAQDHSLSIDSIIALNGVKNVKRLYAGMTVRIPNMDGVPYTVRKGDSLSRISASWGIPLEVILDANDLETDVLTPGSSLFLPGAKMNSTDLKLALGELFMYPIRGRLTSGFGWRNDPFTGVRKYHGGIDLAANIGISIKAAMDGKVSAMGTNPTFGNYIILTHSSGYQTMYAHLNAFSTARGKYVTQGQKIGEVGTTGYSTGPHLHFAVYRNGRALNPLQFLGS